MSQGELGKRTPCEAMATISRITFTRPLNILRVAFRRSVRTNHTHLSADSIADSPLPSTPDTLSWEACRVQLGIRLADVEAADGGMLAPESLTLDT
ncbi:hypothetical protein ARMSODRAFT_1024790 [Armillaria solidipes]|uniref:Uncharacterized protein n=1 Tax=Armillaria solidipes TaxID=1076256 RepID=A0A2H3AV76_9AGAR|nr:hypothetical protein ARMSODRAFT_1024790 [Armillaria solidipes]